MVKIKERGIPKKQTKKTLVCVSAFVLIFVLLYLQAPSSSSLALTIDTLYMIPSQYSFFQFTLTNNSSVGQNLTSWQRKLIEFQLTLDVVRDHFINNVTSALQCDSDGTHRHSKNITLCEYMNGNYRLSLKRLPCDVVAYHDVHWAGAGMNNDSSKSSVLASLPVQHVYRPFATLSVCASLPLWQMAIWKDTIACSASKIGQHAQKTTPITNRGNRLLKNTPHHNSSNFLYSYVTLLWNASINSLGSVSTDGGVTVLPSGCKKTDRFERNDSSSLTPVYDEVFIIAQFWGYSYFHATIASLPRLATYVEFLQRHPHIRLHVGHSSEKDRRTAAHMTASLAALGLDPKRVVSGVIRARIAYLPRATPCNVALLPELQMLSWRFHQYIANHLHETEHASVIMIIRESPKNVRNMARSTYMRIYQQIRILLANSPLKLELFDDRHRLSYPDTLRMFYRARIVIGIHGAGLANMIYSRPGTQVIEMLCQPPDRINLCYVNTALILGHRYHAFPVNNCVKHAEIDMENFIKTVDFYIHAALLN